MISYFNARGSTVFLAALDVKTVFDSVARDKVFQILAWTGIPKTFEILQNLYSKSLVTVLWGNFHSREFCVLKEVRPGSVLPPFLFNVYMDISIKHIRKLDVGCCVKYMFAG